MSEWYGQQEAVGAVLPEVTPRDQIPRPQPQRGTNIAELEQETFDRAWKLNGWTKAAALHARWNRESHFGVVPTCVTCTELVALGRDYDDEVVYVDWPCDTAKALGLTSARPA